MVDAFVDIQSSNFERSFNQYNLSSETTEKDSFSNTWKIL